jgi:hypothetical protein
VADRVLTARLAAAALRPATRSIPAGLVAGVLGLAIAPAVVTVAKGGSELGAALVAACVIGGAVAAFAATEPVQEIASAAAFSAIWRLGLRLVALASGVVIAAAFVAVITHRSDASALDDPSARLAELAATSGLALAAASIGTRRGWEAATLGGAVFGPLCVLTASAFAYRFDWLPSIGIAADASRWWQVAAVAWITAAWASRDPYR